MTPLGETEATRQHRSIAPSLTVERQMDVVAGEHKDLAGFVLELGVQFGRGGDRAGKYLKVIESVLLNIHTKHRYVPGGSR